MGAFILVYLRSQARTELRENLNRENEREAKRFRWQAQEFIKLSFSFVFFGVLCSLTVYFTDGLVGLLG